MQKAHHYFAAFILIGAMLGMPAVSHAAEEPQAGHKQVTGVVVKKGSGLVVKTAEGATYQIDPKGAERHGHEPFKEGDEVTAMIDENNIVMEMHHKGKEGAHTFVTGKLMYVGKMKPEIKLKTAEGEKVFPLGKQEVKTGGIPEGTEVTVELNETGTVIDLHRADATKH